VRGGLGWESLSRSAGLKILALLLAFGLGAAIAVAAGWMQGRSASHSQKAPPQEHAERFSSAYRTMMLLERPKSDIALTFDDGPDPNNTPKVLDALKRYDAKATFFVRGDRARAYPELVRREYQEGHVVGNHAYDHPRLTTLSKPEVERQLRDTNAVITVAGAPKPKLFRPPFWGHRRRCRERGRLPRDDADLVGGVRHRERVGRGPGGACVGLRSDGGQRGARGHLAAARRLHPFHRRRPTLHPQAAEGARVRVRPHLSLLHSQPAEPQRRAD
jgi:polysaccharide deacetylase